MICCQPDLESGDATVVTGRRRPAPAAGHRRQRAPVRQRHGAVRHRLAERDEIVDGRAGPVASRHACVRVRMRLRHDAGRRDLAVEDVEVVHLRVGGRVRLDVGRSRHARGRGTGADDRRVRVRVLAVREAAAEEHLIGRSRDRRSRSTGLARHDDASARTVA